MIAPPWVLYRLVVDFWEQLVAVHPELMPSIGSNTAQREDGRRGGGSWCLLSHRSVLNGDLLVGEPLEITCAPPKVVKRFFVPQWKHSLGLPWMHQPATVVALHVEWRQRELVVASGVFYLGLQKH